MTMAVAITRLRGDGWRYEEDQRWIPSGLPQPIGWISDVAVKPSGSVLLFQREQHKLVEVAADGAHVTSLELDHVIDPHSVVLTPQGGVLLVDRDGQQLLRLNEDGTTSVIVGGAGSPFCHPTDVAVHPDTGDLFVSDGYGNAKVHRFTADGEPILAWGRHGVALGEFNLVHAIAIDRLGRILVNDRENGRVQVFDVDGELLDVWEGFHRPLGLDLLADGSVLVSEGSTRLTVRDSDGKVIAAGRAPNIVHELSAGSDEIYLAIPAEKRVVRLVRREG